MSKLVAGSLVRINSIGLVEYAVERKKQLYEPHTNEYKFYQSLIDDAFEVDYIRHMGDGESSRIYLKAKDRVSRETFSGWYFFPNELDLISNFRKLTFNV